MKPDPKPPARIIDRKAGARKLHKFPQCRVIGCEERATQAHHIILRSQGGDDVEDNLLPLCTECHVNAHSKGEPILAQLKWWEVKYVKEKYEQMGRGQHAGVDYLQRRYLYDGR